MLLSLPDLEQEEFAAVHSRVLANRATCNDKWADYRHLYKRRWGIDKISEDFISEQGTRPGSDHIDLCMKLLWPHICLRDFTSSTQSKQLNKLPVIKQVMEAIGWNSPFDPKPVKLDNIRSPLLETDVFKHYAKNIKLFNPRAIEHKDWAKSTAIRMTLQTVLGAGGIIVKIKLARSGKGKSQKRFYEYSIDQANALMKATLTNLTARSAPSCENIHAAEYLERI